MNVEGNVSTAEVAREIESTSINRSVVLPTRSEDASVINCREIEDWCRHCRDHRPPVLTATTGFVGSLGLFVGCLSGISSTSRPGWHALFLGGTILTAIAMVVFLCVVAFTYAPSVRNKLGRTQLPKTSLQRLADQMERAMTHNRVPAGQPLAGGSTTPQTLTLGLLVVSATYGANGKMADVTAILNALVLNHRLDFHVNNATMGGDPVVGVGKTLAIEYANDGQRFRRTFSEGTHVVLP
jgi:hypothetical protein